MKKILSILIGLTALAVIILYLKSLKRKRERQEEEKDLGLKKDIAERILNYLSDYANSFFKHYICTDILLMYNIDVDKQKEIKGKYPDYKKQLIKAKIEEIIKERFNIAILNEILKEIAKNKMKKELEYAYPVQYMSILYEYEDLNAKLKAHKEIEKYLNERDRQRNYEEIKNIQQMIQKLSEN